MYRKVSPKMPISTIGVAEAFRPVCILNSVLGIMFIEMPAGRPWPKLSFLYVLARSAAYGFLFWYVIFNTNHSFGSLDIMNAVYHFILYANVAIASISTILGFMHYKRVKKVFKRLVLVDETLEIFGVDPEYEVARKLMMRVVIVWCAVGLLIMCTDCSILIYIARDLQTSILTVILFDLPLLYNPIIELNFTVLVTALGKRFERLNALIQNLATTPLQTVNSKNFNKYQNILKRNQSKVGVKPNYYYKNRNNVELLLKTARQLHLELCAISREVNDTCSRQMSMQMAASFLLLTGFSYCLYLIYNEPTIRLAHRLQHYASLGIWIAISIVRIILVVRTSVNVTAEAQKTSQIAHEIQVSRTQNKLTDEIHQLSLQIMQHPLCFTASGLIALDFGYVRGFVGSVTTYLMILIQNQPDMMKAANTLVEMDDDFENTTHSASTVAH